MSYLEYTVKTTPSGLRKVLFLNWGLAILLTAVAGVGFLMLYSVAGGSFSPWAEPQMKRFALGFAIMLFLSTMHLLMRPRSQWPWWLNMVAAAQWRRHLAFPSRDHGIGRSL